MRELPPALSAALARTARHERVRDAEAEPRFDLGELSGRLVEVRGAASLTAAFGLVLDAQRRGEPAAYIAGTHAGFYPPDAAEGGVDLDALVVVRTEAVAARARAADELARSGAFALLVLDLATVTPGRIPQAMLSRLLGLAQKHDTAIVFITSEDDGIGSLVSLRAVTRRETLDGTLARHDLTLDIVKDKRRAPGWSTTERCRGPIGLFA